MAARAEEGRGEEREIPRAGDHARLASQGVSLRSRALVALAIALALLIGIAVALGLALSSVHEDEDELATAADPRASATNLAEATRVLALESVIALALLVIGLAVLSWVTWRSVLQPLTAMRRAAGLSHHPAGIMLPVSIDGPPELREVALATERMRQLALRNREEARAAREALTQDAPLTSALLARTNAPAVREVGSLVTAWRGSAAQGVVGGDWWDAVLRPDGRIGVVIGDVCGHDLEAGLTALTCASMSRASMLNDDAPERTAALLRSCLDQPGAFVTCVIALIDEASITWLNAGHGTAWFVDTDGIVTDLSTTGTLLTAHLPAPHTCMSRPFSVGTALVTCTDGVVERTLLDPERARAIAARTWVDSGHDPHATVDALDLAARNADGSRADDATSVVVSRSRNTG